MTIQRLVEELRQYHRRTGASHFASSASVVGILVEIRSRMKPGDECYLGKAHGVTAYKLVFETLPEDAPVQGEFGSLGSALPFALGVAMEKPENTVWVVVGDGEMQEGSCWEALLAAERLGVRNLRVVVDANGMQGMGDCPAPCLWEKPIPVEWRETFKGTGFECHYANA